MNAGGELSRQVPMRKARGPALPEATQIRCGHLAMKVSRSFDCARIGFWWKTTPSARSAQDDGLGEYACISFRHGLFTHHADQRAVASTYATSSGPHGLGGSDL